jgi:CHAT domain-containing protein
MSSRSVFRASAFLLVLCVAAARAAELPSGARELGLAGWHQMMRGDHQKAVESYSRALAVNASADLQLESSLLQGLGWAHSALDQHGRAVEPLRRSAKLHRELGLYDYDVLHMLGEALERTGDPLGAEAAFIEAANRAAGQGEKDDFAVASRSLAKVLIDLGDYGNAKDPLTVALDAFIALGDKRNTALTLLDAAQLYYRLGMPEGTLWTAEEALRLQKQLGDSTFEPVIHITLGGAYSDLGDAERARESYLRAAELARTHPRGLAARAGALANLGRLQFEQGESAEAGRTLEQALELTIEAGDDANERLVASHLAAAHIAQSRTEEARALARRHDLSQIEASLLLRAGRFREARRLFEDSLVRARAARHRPSILPSALGAAQASEGMGDFRAARRLYEEAVAALELQRERLQLSARERFLSGRVMDVRRIAAYEGRIRTAAGPADGFFWSESAKARTFVESASTRCARGAEGSRDADKTELAALESERSALFGRDEAAFRAKDRRRMAEIAKLMESNRRRTRDVVARLRATDPVYAAARYPQPLEADEIVLRQGEVLVEYAVTEPRTIAYILSSGSPAASVDIPVSRERLESLVKAFRGPLDEPYDALGTFRLGFSSAAASELYDLLLRPLAGARGEDGALLLPAGARLIIVPDGPLGGLPFEALLPDPASSSYAGDGLDIAYAQSATALTVSRTGRCRSEPSSGLFVLADPVFEDCDPRAAKATAEASAEDAERRRVSIRTMGAGDCPRLRETAELSKNLGALFVRDGVRRLEGSQATLTGIERAGLSRYRYLVFATHGYLAGDRPYLREPALLLSRDADRGSFLTMSRVMGMELNADLVALTACNTGMGARVEGEGTLGMGRAFQHAGARNVLMSLWRVEEKSTTRLTEGVFRRLREGAGAREALRAARREVRSGGYAHPFYWAPFVLMAE